MTTKMTLQTTGCLICGRELHYFNPAQKLPCEICGREIETTAACLDKHFVCDDCHAQRGCESITRLALNTDQKNPVLIAQEMMSNSFINMHGPEHHYLVVAALLAAYKNAGGQVNLDESLPLALQRAKKVPGGICGFWGCCGAAVGTGIFLSLITGATPLSVDQWRLANKMTSLSLEAISNGGGPRCCKRDTFLAILTAIKFIKDEMGLSLEEPEATVCSFYSRNPSCKKAACIFFPK